MPSISTMALGLTIIGTTLLVAGLWGGQTRQGITGTIMAAMAMGGVIMAAAGIVSLFVPGFFRMG